MVTLAEVKDKQVDWFSPQNKRFFGDVAYTLLHDADKKPFLVRQTSAWSDMFGQAKSYTFRVNRIDSGTLKIGSLLDQEFDTLEEVKDFLKN